MKQIFLLAAALCAAMHLSAQTTRGTFALGFHSFSPSISNTSLLAPTNAFGIAFGTTKNESRFGTSEEKYFSFGLNGSLHYFLIDNFSLGVNLNGFSQTSTDQEDDTKATLSLVMAGPELRYYINAGAKSKVFLRAGAAFGSAKTKYDSDLDFDSKDNLTQFGGGVGLALFLRDNVSLDLGAGYASLKSKTDGDDDDTYTNNGVTIDLGFTIFLSR